MTGNGAMRRPPLVVFPFSPPPYCLFSLSSIVRLFWFSFLPFFSDIRFRFWSILVIDLCFFLVCQRWRTVARAHIGSNKEDWEIRTRNSGNNGGLIIQGNIMLFLTNIKRERKKAFLEFNLSSWQSLLSNKLLQDSLDETAEAIKKPKTSVC